MLNNSRKDNVYLFAKVQMGKCEALFVIVYVRLCS